MVTRTNSQGLANLVLATIVWILFLLALAAILSSRRLFSQSAGAVRTQEIYSSTHHVKIDNSINTPVITVTYAASTTFDANLGEHFTETLTGNVTSSTLSNAVAGANYFFSICQDATGNRTFAWPSNFQNAPTIVATASKCTNVVGFYDGTNFDITGQWNTASGGAGTGTVTSVAMTMPGTIFNSSVSGSPITTSGTLAPSLVPVQAGYVLAGPVAAQGSNVSVRQFKACALAVSGSTACAFSSPVISGDYVLVVGNQASGTWAGSISDSLGSTFTDNAAFGEGPYSYALLASGGSDTVTLAVQTAVNHTGKAIIIEIGGSGTLQATVGCQFVNGKTCTSGSFTPSAATDGAIAIPLANTWSGASSSTYSTNPTSTVVGSYSVTTVNATTFNGSIFVFAPQSVSSQTLTLNLAQTSAGADYVNFLVFDFSQSASAFSAPPIYRALQEGDLPPSAISALQSVTSVDATGDTSITVGTALNIVSQTITMPADGCPCRVLVQYHAYLWSSGTGPTQFIGWVTDGTNEMAAAISGVAGNTASGISASEMSPVPYSNNQSITFTLKGTSAGAGSTNAYTVFASPTACASGGCTSTASFVNGPSEKTRLTLSVMQSRN